MGGYAFWQCGSLYAMVLPDFLTSIGIFVRCFLHPRPNPHGCGGLIVTLTLTHPNTYCAQAFQDCGGLTVTLTLTHPNTYCAQAFQDCGGLHAITFSDTLEEIGEDAFCGCLMLEELVFPDTMTVISQSAFMGYVSLPSLSANLPSWGAFLFLLYQPVCLHAFMGRIALPSLSASPPHGVRCSPRPISSLPSSGTLLVFG